ncbi:hypothetical protein [uncultured Dokdonia sp.]|uniref:hypothetical protein n=1 Tax=uncultured Dokdonia sp. TaxID=575653 RepID=UPI00262A812D|nr:hypothetical protein [uncultured Dokdonia sp.]
MYKYLLLLLCIGSIISCQKDIEVQENLYSLLDIKEDEQYFSIPLDSVVTIKGKKGTELTLHSQDFELNGDDDLQLLLIELQDPMDFVMHNVQTVSDDKWLNSGGSYYIEVTQNGIAVPLKKEHTLKVKFPKITDQSMDLFKGKRSENGDMNWRKLEMSLDYKKYKTFLIRDTVVFDEFHTYKYGVDTYMNLPIVENKGLMSRKTSDILFKSIKVDTFLIVNDTIIGIDSEAKYVHSEIGNTSKMADSVLNLRDASIEEIRKLLKNQNSISNKLDSLKITWKIESQRLDTLRAKEKSLNEKIRLANQKQQLLLYKEIELATQGWINVDRFNEFQFNEEATLTITNDYIQYVYIVFDRTKTIVRLLVPFKKTIDIPVNEPFTLIAFNVLENGDAMGYKHTMELNNDINVQVEFTKVANSEVKKWLYQE